MFGTRRLTTFADVFNLHREVERMFNQTWSEMPLRGAAHPSPSIPFGVESTDDGWRIDVPLPGIDPKDVKLEVAGNTLTVRAQAPGDTKDAATRYEQSLTVPQFVDLDKLSATHRHGMLRISLPIRDTVRPRAIEIQTQHDDQRQLTASQN